MKTRELPDSNQRVVPPCAAPTSWLALCAVLALALSSCISIGYGTHGIARHRWGDRSTSTLPLGTRELENGLSTFSVDRDEPGQVSILRETATTSEVAHFGLSVASVGTDVAAERGLTPWMGVLVTAVAEERAADVAGIRKHDLLVAFNGVELTSEEQIAEFIASTRPGEQVVLGVSRAVEGGGRETLDVPIDVGAREVSKTSTERLPFATESAPWRRAGIEVFTVPSELAFEIWNSTAPVTLVTHVVPGSPGYLAGIRSGDHVLGCNEFVVEHARDISALMSEGDDSVYLVVDGDLGPHESRVELVDDITDETGFDIPILIERSTRVDRSSTSVLDFIFQFGFNKRTRYLAAEDREPAVKRYVSILPLGMFEFTRSPGRSTNRIFWIIRWSTK